MSEAAANPEYTPSGVGDCIDTNKLPWIPIPNAPGMSIKPARASGETVSYTHLPLPTILLV